MSDNCLQAIEKIRLRITQTPWKEDGGKEPRLWRRCSATTCLVSVLPRLCFSVANAFLVPSHSVVSNCSATQWTLTQQAPLSVGFPRQEHWSGLPSPSPGGLPDAGIETASPASQAGSLPLSLQGSPDANELHSCLCICLYRSYLQHA